MKFITKPLKTESFKDFTEVMESFNRRVISV